jgi:TRAP transporter TAXI family solute receptor
MSAQPTQPADSTRTRRAWIAGAVGTLAIVTAAVVIARRKRTTLRLATGVRDGSFFALGHALARAIHAGAPEVRIDVTSTGGSVENLAMLKEGRAELAFASSAVPAVDGVSIVCPLGDEVAHLIVRKSLQIRSASELAGKSVSVGPERSGTRFAALSVLAHFGLGDGAIRARSLSPNAAKSAFDGGEVDAVFLLTPLRDPIVEALLAGGDAELLSLGAPDEVGSALDGICASAPSFQRAVIPVLAYGTTPTRPIGTVKGTTYLLARNTLSDALVAKVTEALFRDKVGLARVDGSLSRMSEQFDRGSVTYPLHVGADQYFRRDAPSFIERYSDPISLAMSLLAVLWSAMNALRGARQRARLHRLDDVHRDCAALEQRSRDARTREHRRSVYEDSDALRTRVFDQLVAGNFVADDAFRVLVLRLDALIARNDDVPGMALAPVPLPPQDQEVKDSSRDC